MREAKKRYTLSCLCHKKLHTIKLVLGLNNLRADMVEFAPDVVQMLLTSVFGFRMWLTIIIMLNSEFLVPK